MPAIAEIRWTPAALRQVTEWVAAFARDEIALRALRTAYVEMIEYVIYEADGYPGHATQWGPDDARVVEWEFVGRELWVTHTVRKESVGFWSRLFGRRSFDVAVISALRRPRTAQERATLDT
jgi:hypothetical protein